MIQNLFFSLLLCSGLMALSAPPGCAQTSPAGASWTVAPSVSVFHWLDRQGSPLRYRASTWGGQAGYARTGARWSVQAGLVAQAGSLAPVAHPERFWYSETVQPDGSTVRDSFPIGGMLVHAQAHAAVMRACVLRERLRADAGLGAEAFVSYPSGFVRTGYLWANALTIKGLLSYLPSDKWRLTGGISLPVVAVVTRLPYHNTLAAPGESNLGMFFHQGTSVVSWGGYVAPEVSLAASRRMNMRLSLGAGYDFRWLRVTPALPMTLTRSGFNVVVTLHSQR